MSKYILLLGVTLQLLVAFDLLNAFEQDLCNSRLKLLSIFNLGDDIFFQDQDEKIWKMNDTDIGYTDDLLLTRHKFILDEQMKRLLSSTFGLCHSF